MIDISSLNNAQKQAVTAPDGPLLVIAGAGSGKTRTIVYRLAWLAEQGIPPYSMLLLTFTRKASQEMLHRASLLADGQFNTVQGGTFHGYAYSVLRRYSQLNNGIVSIIDTPDSTSILQGCKEEMQIAKGDRAFPRAQMILGLISKSRNKEVSIDKIIAGEAQHLLPYSKDLDRLAEAYQKYKLEHCLVDYDDLLFNLERLFLDNPDVLKSQQNFHSYIMVDEYQDTNKVQARIVKLLSGDRGNIMAVGDDAQSIYAFRGATVYNILNFKEMFPESGIIRLEENYRSVQPILDVANAVLEKSTEGYEKHLFSRRDIPEEKPVTIYHPMSDISQAQIAARRIAELLEINRPHDIAVLFRSGYQSYHLEVELNKLGIKFRKYGGMRYNESAHVKDVLAFMRLVLNPLDMPSFTRIAGFFKGIGPKTAEKIFHAVSSGNPHDEEKSCKKWPELLECIKLIESIRTGKYSPESALKLIIAYYREKMPVLFPDDWPKRYQGLEQMISIASGYTDMQNFLADISLDGTDEKSEDDEESCVVLSTIHSAKGLEWNAVLIIDLVQDRFPSHHAMVRPEDFEEERRLMYVACTRAKDSLDLFVPVSVYNRAYGGQDPVDPSVFIEDINKADFAEIYELYGGTLSERVSRTSKNSFSRANNHWEQKDFSDEEDPSYTSGKASIKADDEFLDFMCEKTITPKSQDTITPKPQKLGFCNHRIFGRGKIIEVIPPDRYRVNFAGFGVKVILSEYVTLEQP